MVLWCFIRMGRECGWKPITDTNVDTVDTKTDTNDAKHGCLKFLRELGRILPQNVELLKVVLV